MTTTKDDIKKGDIYISKFNHKNKIVVKDVTEMSIVEDSKEGRIIPIKILSANFIKFSPPIFSEAVKQEIKKEDLKVGMVLEPFFKSRLSEEIRKVTLIGDSYYLYVDISHNEQERRETRGDFDQLDRLTIRIVENKEERIKLQRLVREYKERSKEIKSDLKKLLEAYELLKTERNNEIKTKLKSSLIKGLFSDHEAFCLINEIPVKLNKEQVNHLTNSKVALREREGDVISNPFNLDAEEIYEQLYYVKYFDNSDFINEVENLVDEVLLVQKGSN